MISRKVTVTIVATIAPMSATVRRRGTLMLLSRLSKMAIRNTPESLIEMKTRQYVALSYIGDPGGVSQQKLGEILCMDANNVVLLLNELEDERWIRRVRDPSDRRRHIVEITEAGRAKLNHALEARETLEGEILGNLDPDERTALHELLVKAIGDET
jgi:DNA-binding MarR family transcriptional regulator